MAKPTDPLRSRFYSWRRCFILFALIVLHLSCDKLFADSQDKASSETFRAAPPKPAEVPIRRLPTRSRQWTLYARMKNAAYPELDAPAVAVHAPAGFDPQTPLHLVVFLHGFRGCVRVLMEAGQHACTPRGSLQQGWGLSHHHDAASTNTLFLIPQLAFMKRDGNPGCFGNKGCFRSFLQELLSETLAEKLTTRHFLKDIGSITLIAHSAGFEAALAIVEQGEVSALVRHLVLMDALYAGVERFARWFLSTPIKQARLISINLGKGKTHRQSLRLQRILEKRIGRDNVASASSAELKRAIQSSRAVIALGRGPHGKVPENYLTEVLSGLDLPSIK